MMKHLHFYVFLLFYFFVSNQVQSRTILESDFFLNKNSIFKANALIGICDYRDFSPVFNNMTGIKIDLPVSQLVTLLRDYPDVSVSDNEFDSLDNWGGAILTVKSIDPISSNDIFGFDTINSTFQVLENNLIYQGLTFASINNTTGSLTINFNEVVRPKAVSKHLKNKALWTSKQTIPTTELVNDVLKHITYSNKALLGNADIVFSMSDGTNSTSEVVTVSSNNIYVDTNTEELPVNSSNGISLTEAFWIVNNSTHSNPTIVFNAGLRPINLIHSEILTLNKPIVFDTQGNSVVIIGRNPFNNISGLSKNGSGILLLFNFNNVGPIFNFNVGAGTLSLLNSSLKSNIDVNNGATLEAQGILNDNITLNGNLKIGGLETGNLMIQGQLNMGSTSNLIMRINNKVSDVIILNQPSVLNGSLSVLTNNFNPLPTDQFTFIKSLGQYSGMFNAYPEGSNYKIDNKNFILSYKGGIGNDVVLTYPALQTIWENNKWSNGNPDYTKDAIIKEQYNESVTANSVTFDTNITIPTGVSYSIKNQVINLNNRQVVFEDGAYLIQENSVTNSGTISFKRKSKPIYRLETMDWSSPVTGQKVFELSPLTLTNRFYHFDETTNTWVNNLTSNSVFTPGEYIAFRAPNTFNNNGSGAAKVFEGTFTGVPNNGNVSVPVTQNNFGNNAVGNPYPSPIDLDKFFKGNTQVSKIYVWTHSKPINSEGKYEGDNWNVVSTGSGSSSSSSLTVNETIGVGQGFIVQIAQQQITPRIPIPPYLFLQFSNTMRVGSQPTISYKNAMEDDKFWLALKKKDDVISETLIGYIEGSTMDNDSYFDAEPMEEFPGIYSMLDNGLMKIQARGSKFDMNDEITLGLKFNSADNYTIKIAKTNGLFSQGQSIFLKDNELNKIVDLTKEDYQFISDKGEFKNRFEIVYQASTLGTIENTMNNDVMIYNSGQQIYIKADEMIQSVKVFDLSGKLITSFNSVNDKKLTFSIPKQTNIAIVVVNLTNGKQISKKVMIK